MFIMYQLVARDHHHVRWQCTSLGGDKHIGFKVHRVTQNADFESLSVAVLIRTVLQGRDLSCA